MDLRYPIGRFEWPASVAPAGRVRAIKEIEALPRLLREAVAGLTREQLDTPYRPEGWTVRQVVHHVADSHINSYTRFRLAVTEDQPVIKPYDERMWAELADARSAPIEPSLALLDGLHARWVLLLRSFRAAEWRRVFVHPEHGPVRVDTTARLYAWHGRHHVAQVAGLRSRKGW